MSRRGFLKTTLGVTAGATAMTMLGSGVMTALTGSAQAAPAPVGGIGFTSIPANLFTNASDA